MTPVTGVSFVNDKIYEIIGLTRDQFAQTVMIAQGDFMKILTAPSAERKALFQRIFKTEKFANLQEELRVRKSLMDDKAEAIEFYISEDSTVTNTPLCDLKIKANTIIACIYRNGKVIVPGGQDCILVGDSVILITTDSGLVNISDILR